MSSEGLRRAAEEDELGGKENLQMKRLPLSLYRRGSGGVPLTLSSLSRL